jgi:hypothetical protein
VTPKVKRRIVACLWLGLSLADALLAAGVSRAAFRRARAVDAKFGRGVKNAAIRGKSYHLRRVARGVENWQSSAWFLERKYGTEYGQRVKVEHGGRVEVAEHVVRTRAEGQAALSSLGETGPLPGSNGER